jgi:methionyl aminopeptidase
VVLRRSRIEIKTARQLNHMRAAGLVVAGALDHVAGLVAPGVTTRDLDVAAAEFIRAAGAESNFKGYQGFPSVICTSVNDEIVHGIPGNRVLQAGDLISIDCGAIVAGWHGDSAITVPVGEVSAAAGELSQVAEAAMWAGIAAACVGARLTDIGAACEASISGRYGIVRDYVGHGIGSAMHMEPSVPHVGPAGRGPVLRAGMALAIEPMITAGSEQTEMRDDGWTVCTRDGSLAAHWEHTVAITDEGPAVLTAGDLGAAKLAEFGIAVASFPLADSAN